jgi:hypothetical protein
MSSKGTVSARHALVKILFRLRRIFVLVSLNSAGYAFTSRGGVMENHIAFCVRPVMSARHHRLVFSKAEVSAGCALD